MKEIVERPFCFRFPDTVHCVRHDGTDPGDDGNKIWHGIDFRIIGPPREVWVEVKSWSFKKILERSQRHAAKRDYSLRTAGLELRDEIVQKFLATSAVLSWAGIDFPSKVLFVVLLEPPNSGVRPLLGPFHDVLREEFKNAQSKPWGRRIAFKVVDKNGYSALFPGYEVDWS
jgi:hypothetical protein